MLDIEKFALEALDFYGVQAQAGKSIEEGIEFCAAMIEFAKNRCESRPSDVDEVADVLIMATQKRIAVGSEAVDKRIAFKISRQRARMEAQ